MKARSRSIHLSVHIHKDPAAMAERAAHILAAACEEAVAERGVFRIALSGGQTPIPLFRLLAARDWADRLPWDKMTFFWVDERCVGPEHPDSNYGLARRELAEWWERECPGLHVPQVLWSHKTGKYELTDYNVPKNARL